MLSTRDKEAMLSSKCNDMVIFSKTISGIPCVVNCCLMNGVIIGNINLNNSTLNYKFEMLPIVSKDSIHDINLEKEMCRLYFNYTMNDFSTYNYIININNKTTQEDTLKEGIIQKNN